jgi:phosphopantothenoylcysteine decarboxylase
VGDSVLHIDLRRWADVLVIAPLSANTLARISNGLCDDTLTCVARAWEFGRPAVKAKPIILAPAMNTAMWLHRLTQQQLDMIRGFYGAGDASMLRVVQPQSKMLACGDIGDGALAEVPTIVETVFDCLKDQL